VFYCHFSPLSDESILRSRGAKRCSLSICRWRRADIDQIAITSFTILYGGSICRYCDKMPLPEVKCAINLGAKMGAAGNKIFHSAPSLPPLSVLL
jgi:hypothetical protein